MSDKLKISSGHDHEMETILTNYDKSTSKKNIKKLRNRLVPQNHNNRKEFNSMKEKNKFIGEVISPILDELDDIKEK